MLLFAGRSTSRPRTAHKKWKIIAIYLYRYLYQHSYVVDWQRAVIIDVLVVVVVVVDVEVANARRKRPEPSASGARNPGWITNGIPGASRVARTGSSTATADSSLALYIINKKIES